MPFLRIRDLDVYFELHGDGVPVVLLSGTGADLRQNPARGRGLLERSFCVLMYDQRGLGQTSKPDVPYTMADYADDCAELMTAVGWERAHVVGVSFGGMVAQHLALRHPQRIGRLVLACTSSGGDGGASFDLLAAADLAPEERVQLLLPVMDLRNDLSTDPPTLAPWFERLLPAMLAGESPNAGDLLARMGARRQLEARADHDVWNRLGEIAQSTFVIGGTYDGQAPVANVERLASRLPDARLQFFDGGHLFLLQDPAAWPAVMEFLGGAAPTT